MEKLINEGAKLKKCVAYKKFRYFRYIYEKKFLKCQDHS